MGTDNPKELDAQKVRARLREALELATGCNAVFLEVQIALALGHVIRRESIARSALGASSPDVIGTEIEYVRDVVLQARVLEALIMADTLGERRVAISLNDALVHLTGSGIAPDGLLGRTEATDTPEHNAVTDRNKMGG